MSDKNKPKNIVLGASGRVGSAVADALLKNEQPVKAVIRNPDKAGPLKAKGAEVAIADVFDLEALKAACKDGDTAFFLTPENPESEDIFGGTEQILNNYRAVLQDSEIRKIVGLSSMGAQYPSGTGNLIQSYMLEYAFADLPVKKIFIRPAYYYSNWLGYMNTVKEQGILPTFFPVDLKIPMAAPEDVGEVIAEAMIREEVQEKVYEISGPDLYSAADVARITGDILNRKVEAQQIPRSQWKEILTQVGFSRHAADELIKMTEAVIDGRAQPEKTNVKQLPTSLETYLAKMIE